MGPAKGPEATAKSPGKSVTMKEESQRADLAHWCKGGDLLRAGGGRALSVGEWAPHGLTEAEPSLRRHIPESRQWPQSPLLFFTNTSLGPIHCQVLTVSGELD